MICRRRVSRLTDGLPYLNQWGLRHGPLHVTFTRSQECTRLESTMRMVGRSVNFSRCDNFVGPIDD